MKHGKDQTGEKRKKSLERTKNEIGRQFARRERREKASKKVRKPSNKFSANPPKKWLKQYEALLKATPDARHVMGEMPEYDRDAYTDEEYVAIPEVAVYMKWLHAQPYEWKDHPMRVEVHRQVFPPPM